MVVKRAFITRYLATFTALSLGILLLFTSFVFASTFFDRTQSDFLNGTFVNTTYSGSAVVLQGSNLTGTFTSRVFNATVPSRWNSLNTTRTLPISAFLISSDIVADVWQSINNGTTWTKINDDYNGANTNGGDGTAKNTSNALFIVDVQRIWSSIDGGTTWALVNSDFNGGPDSNSGIVMTIDRANRIYVIDGSEDMYTSSDSGTSFTRVAIDFNGAGGNIFGIAANSTNAVTVVDSLADVWQSINNGTTWTKINDDYNGAIGNHATDMAINSSNGLFILDDQDLWQSVNNGVTWTLVNDDFNNGDGNAGITMTIDTMNVLYVVDASEDAYRSNNSGVNFTRVAIDFNGGNGNVFGITSFQTYATLRFQIRNCSSPTCADGVFVGPDGTANTYFTNISNGFNYNGTYFQYIAYFAAPVASAGPSLFNTTIDYSILNTAPSIVIVSPENLTYSSKPTQLNYTAIDAEGNFDKCWYSINGGAVNSTPTGCANSFNVGLAAVEGSNTWDIYVNDTFGFANSSRVTFFVDSLAPSIVVTSPANNSYLSSSAITVLYTVSDNGSGLGSCWWTKNGGLVNTSVVCGEDILFTAIEGATTVRVYSNDTFGNENSSRVTFFVDTTGPLITLIQPADGQSFGYNQSIPLQYTVSDDGIGLSSCWYSISEGVNRSLPSCQNTVFNVSVNGDYTVTIYANDSFGSQNSVTHSFSVQVGAPSIQVTSPLSNTYLNTTQVVFRYNVTDIPANDLRSCELWGNFTGIYGLNQTNSTVVSGLINSFKLILSEGSYRWALACNDSSGNKAYTSNLTLTIDTTSPLVSIIEPVGIKSSLTGIPLTFSFTEPNPFLCRYNVTRASTGLLEIPTTTIPNCASTSFDVASEIGYVLTLQVVDAAGNTGLTNSSFSVDVPEQDGNNGGGGSGSGGGGGPSGVTGLASLDLSAPELLILKRGRSETVVVSAFNVGSRFLNSCEVTVHPEGLIVSQDSSVKSFSSGERYDYTFVVNSPSTIQPGTYQLQLDFNCTETSTSVQIPVQVVISDFDFAVSGTNRSAEELRVFYVLQDYTGKDQEITVNYTLLSNQQISLVKGEETVQLGAFVTKEGSFIILLPKNSFGEFTLILDASSTRDSLKVEKEVTLSAGITGFAISDANVRALSYGAIVIFCIVLGFLAVRFIKSYHLRTHYHVASPKRFVLKK